MAQRPPWLAECAIGSRRIGKTQPMKLSFLTHRFEWGGGLDLIRHLASSVASVSHEQGVRCQIIVPSNEPAPGMNRSFFERQFSDAGPNAKLSFSGSRYVDQLNSAAEFGADVVLPCLEVPPPGLEGRGVSWIGYIYDFQHRYYPAFFSEEERRFRDGEFSNMLSRGCHVIVNARAVRDDAGKFLGDFPAKIHVLPFSAYAQRAWLETVLDVRPRYRIDRPYFIMCSQFWVHKDHATAFRAFARFIQQGGDALLVCTGRTADHRFPKHFEGLKSLVDQLGVSGRVLMLGHIDKTDQMRLVKQALAVVQPTLFEGGPGGGAVYDAVSLGVPAIVSDIPVNREIESGAITYFIPGDDVALSNAMAAVVRSPPPRPSYAAVWQDGIARKRRLGAAVLDVARKAVQDRLTLAAGKR
jgi:glycosyltransferase involved in cell wall biosynthesis